MPRREDMDRHDRPSWREMDKKRDRSRHGSDEGRREPRTEKARAESKAAKEAYLKKLDEKLFGGTKKKTAGKGEQAVREARGTRGFSEACDAYVEQNGFPASGDLLILFLDHENSEVVLRAIEALTALARAQGVDRDALARALRRLKTMTDDADVDGAADDLLQALP